jgi:ABC-2 type transport system ATP-binding protein
LAIDGGAMHVKDILVQMEDAKVSIESLSLHKPTLDDVFLSLTGRQTSEVADTTAAKDQKGGK